MSKPETLEPSLDAVAAAAAEDRAASPRILNIAAYRFVPVDDVPALRDRVWQRAEQLSLKGTVLVASEGINFSIAGSADDARAFVRWLEQDARFSGLASGATLDAHAKESWSRSVPFGKLQVKIRREIIRMNHPTIRPAAARAPSVDAATLLRWLDDGGVDDDGMSVVMLDTRNAFEVEHGRFTNALHLQLAKFSDFPARLVESVDAVRGKRVVTYCTGGIRCEKAALFMTGLGIDNVAQLDGGILKYFERVGRKHFVGDCFVFDRRIALDAALGPTGDDLLFEATAPGATVGPLPSPPE